MVQRVRRGRQALEQAASDIDWLAVKAGGVAVFLLGLITTTNTSLGTAFTAAICVAALGILGVSVLKRPEWSLYALAAYLPFSRELPGDFGGAAKALNLTNLLCLAILAGWSASGGSRRKDKPLRGSAMGKLVLLFCVWGAISLIRGALEMGGGYLAAYLTPLKQWLTPMLIYYLVRMVVSDRRVIKTMAVIIMITVSVVALMAVKDYQLEGQFASSLEKARIGGIAEQPNMLGSFFANYGLLMLGVLSVFTHRPGAWWLMVPLMILTRGIQVTFSRGAYLALALGAMTIFFFRNKMLWIMGMVLAVVVAVTPALQPGSVRERMNATMQGETTSFYGPSDSAEHLEPSARNRIYAWRGAMRMIQDEPFLGIGYGFFARKAPEYAPELKGAWIDAHNEYLLIAAEMGLPMLAIFLLILWTASSETYWVWKNSSDPMIRAIALGFLGGLTALTAGNMFGSRMQAQEISGYFWVLAALMTKLKMTEPVVARKRWIDRQRAAAETRGASHETRVASHRLPAPGYKLQVAPGTSRRRAAMPYSPSRRTAL